VVAPSLGRGGAERAVSRLTREWARSHAVFLALFDASRNAYPFGGNLIDLGVPAGSGVSGGLRRVLRLRKAMRALRPDHIFAFMETANIPVLLAALSCGMHRKVTLSVRGNPARMRWFHKALAFALYGLAGRVAAVSRGVAERLARLAPACRTRLEVLYSPLPLREIEREAGVLPGSSEAEEPFFLAAGRLVPGKGLERLVDLFAIAACPGIRLLIAGEGPLRAALEARIRERGLEGRVRLLGALENPFAWMARARAFLLASEHEGFPMALIEALACGCPVLAFDCDYGPREALVQGQNGFLVAPDDDSGFIEALERLAADDALRRRLGDGARATASAFDAPAMAARWLPPGRE
jgi:glycosyltransferase involved in cell wall biosynthesis